VRRPRRWTFDVFDDRDTVSVGGLAPDVQVLFHPRRTILNKELHPALAVLMGSVLRRPKLILSTEVARPPATICKAALHTPTISRAARHTVKISKVALHTPTISKNAKHTVKISKAARYTPKISKKAEFNVC